MIDELAATWRLADARLYAADTQQDRYPETDVIAAAETAVETLGAETEDPEGYAVPLFDPQTPTPTNEYVVYRPAAAQLAWRDTGFGVSGTVRFVDATDHASTEIGHRLRFWLPDRRPAVTTTVSEDDLPPRTLPAANPLDDEAAVSALFDEIAAAVHAARDRELAAARDAYRRRDRRQRGDGPTAVGPFSPVDGSESSATADGYRYRLDDADLRANGLYADTICLADAHAAGFPVPVRLVSVEDPHVTLRVDERAVDGSRTVGDETEDDTQSPDGSGDPQSPDGSGDTQSPGWSGESTHARGRLDAGVQVWLAPLVTPVPYDRRLSAVETGRRDEATRALLSGREPLAFSANSYALPEPQVELDRHQHDALVWADSADDLGLIHGPPGTGKTRTLTAVVLAAVEKGQSVLVSAHSNRAVDNLLVGESTPRETAPETLHAAAERGDIRIARVGRNTNSPVVASSYVETSPDRADVVAATTNGAARFEENSFDLAVVDEATQASRAATLVPLACAEKLVLAGDHRQLPPYTAGEAGSDRQRPSLFETLLDRYGESAAVRLRRQYRMHEQIAAFPNETFYDGELETAEAVRERTVGDLDPVVGIDVRGDCRRHGEVSYANEREADLVVREVRRLLDAGLSPDDIGVITPYRGQRAVLRDRLESLPELHSTEVTSAREATLTGGGVTHSDSVETHSGNADVHSGSAGADSSSEATRHRGDTERDHLVVDTVDAFQGGERTAVVVSFVRSGDGNRSGFLTAPSVGPRRLNVALTRARRRLVLVGDWETLGSTAVDREASESRADVYADLAAWLEANGLMRAAE